MKNLSKRTKTLLAIAAVVLVVVVAVIGFAKVSGSGLFGTAVYAITPDNPTVKQGETVTLCTPPRSRWSSDKPEVAAVADGNDTKLVECIEVKGVAKGQATITGKASPYGVNQTQTTVTVR